MKLNPLTQIDFYKADHRRQYPAGTEFVFSNGTHRSDKIYQREATQFYNGKVVNFGLSGFIQWFLIDIWNTEFFNKPKDVVVTKYKRRLDTSLGKDAVLNKSELDNIGISKENVAYGRYLYAVLYENEKYEVN